MAENHKINVNPKLQEKLVKNAYAKNLDKHPNLMKDLNKSSQSTSSTSKKSKNVDTINVKNTAIQSNAELKNPITDVVKGQTTSSQQCSAVSQNGKKCPNFCREEGFFILPLSYAVATSESNVKSLPQNLGQNVSQINLTKHKYTVKMIDTGYIYVFFKRGSESVWKGYITNVKGYHEEFPIGNPAPLVAKDFSCKSGGHSFRASFISIPEIKPNDVTKVYIIRTHAPLNKSKRTEFQNNAEAFVTKGYWQKIDLSGWKGGNQNQTHCFSKSNLDKVYLGSQTFDGGRWKEIDNQFFCMSKFTCAIALYDAIGITRQLNDNRNIKAFGNIEKFLNTKENGTTNNHKLQTLNLVDNIEKAINEKIIKTKNDSIDAGKNLALGHLEYDPRISWPSKEVKDRVLNNTRKNFENDKDIQAKKAQALEDAKKETKDGFKKYQEHLDLNAMSAFRTKVDDISKNGFILATQYQDDHYNWLTSKSLINGLYYFDQSEKLIKGTPLVGSNGFLFHIIILDLMYGVTFLKSGNDLLHKWINKNKIDDGNLFLRAYCYNNKKLQDSYEDFFSSNETGKAILDYSKPIFGLFKGADDAFDEWLKLSQNKSFLSKFGFKPSDKLFYWMSLMLNSALETFSELKAKTISISSISIVAKDASRTHVVSLFYLRSGDFAQHINLVQLMHNHEFRAAALASLPTPLSSSKPYTYRNVHAESMHNATQLSIRDKIGSSKNRILAIVGIFELLNFYFQYDAWKADLKDKPELFMQLVAASLTSSSVMFEMLGERWSHDPTLIKSVNSIRTLAGSFGIVASFLSFYVDGKKFVEASSTTIKIVVALNISANIAVAIGQIGGLSSAVAKYTTNEAIKKSLMKFSETRLISFLLGARVIFGLNLFILSLFIIEALLRKFVLDNALEDWCQKSAFHKVKSGEIPFKNEDEEYEEYVKAIGSA